jgi:hypothetical protein
MQEFAVIAKRVIQYGKERAIDRLNHFDEELSKTEFYDLYTPEEIDSMLGSYKKYVDKFEPPTGRQAKVFKDADKIASWAKSAVDELSQFGILEGNSDDYLNPTELLSKTRFLVFLYKFNQRFELASSGPLF